MQVNTWNEERRNRKEEKFLLLELKTEFEANRRALSNYTKGSWRQIERINYYSSKIEAAHLQLNPDSLRFLVHELSNIQQSNPINNVMKSLENSTKINLIKKKELRKYFTVWKNAYTNLIKADSEILSLKTTETHPMVDQYFILKDVIADGTFNVEVIPKSKCSESVEAFFNKPKNRNLFNRYLVLCYTQSATSSWMIGIADEVLEIINEELKRYDDIKTSTFYTHIQIEGSGIDNDHGFVKMSKAKKNKGVWTADVKLKNGEITFENRKSGSIVWAGETFPKGKIIDGPGYWEPGIIVEKGTYKVIFNLDEQTYEFIKKENE